MLKRAWCVEMGVETGGKVLLTVEGFFNGWRGFLTGGGVPKQVVELFNGRSKQVVGDPK